MTSPTSTSSAAGTAGPVDVRPPRRRREFWRSPTDQPRWARPSLLAVAALAALLYAGNITSSGFAPYYSVAARSMSQSWKAFLFTTVDPEATVTLDKIGGFLWPQALSARVFGFHDWALTLPQCLMGVVAVLVMYRVVRRWQGPAAGLLAAGLLTVTPVAASMFGHAMMDGSLTLCLVLAADQYQKAVDGARLRPLLLSALWVGLGFQTKMMEAWLVVPALCAGHLVAAPVRLRRRLGHLTAAGTVLFAVSLSWVALLTFTPADDRPYVEGSTGNSAFAMVFGYNGFNRLHAGLVDGASPVSGSGDGPQNGAGAAPTAPPASSRPGQPGDDRRKGGADGEDAGRTPSTTRPSGASPGGADRPGPGRAGDAPPGGGARQASAVEPESGALSRLKLLRNERFTPQIGWLYPLALLSLVLGLVRHRGAPRTDRARAGYLMWGVWLATTAGVLSAITITHTAYVASLAPPLAALSAAGTVALWRAHRSATGRRVWVLPAVIAVQVGWTVHLAADYTGFAPWLIPVVAAAALVAVLVLGLRPTPAPRRRLGAQHITVAGLLAGCVAMFAAPTTWSLSVLDERHGGSAFDASAGPPPAGLPESQGGFTNGDVVGAGGDTSMTADQRKSLAYVKKHTSGAKYSLSAQTLADAGPYVHAKGLSPVLLTGGPDAESVSLAEYRDLVATGDLRFALVTGQGTKASRISAWVASACAAVDPADYGGRGGGGDGSPVLYRCAASDAARP
ncbi:glycosyltransferase family 39 protein [Streptomyces luteocolor]|uniref:glycosyltransferase family 39 protein n=1 Tax=Streptomyces luteocolor TaxID=285500 RepID=UPI000853A6E3|nr:glycosyltransferase family 39 protein [Streptomyces luteocolor]